jgi:hypothetical protein
MEKQSSGNPRLSAWHEWNVPPLWVFVVGGLVLIGISTVIFMKIGESMTASQVPAVPVNISDQAGEGATVGGPATTGPDPRL